MKTLKLIALASILLFVFGCDKVTPVAPAGTTLSLSATPSEIAATGTSTIQVVARRQNGTPVNLGTQIRFTTSLGSIDDIAATDADGLARATLRGDGRLGMATVTASSGASESATVDIQVGRNAQSVSLQATPSSVADTGGTVDLLVLVRDSDGLPLPGINVNFQTEVGTLASRGGFLTTDSQGQRTDRVIVTQDQLGTLTSDNFDVSVQASGETMLISETFQVRVDRPLRADFLSSVNSLSAAFTDQSTGEPTSWSWDFGDGNTSFQQNPTHTYQMPGDYQVTLTIRNNRGGTDIATKTIRVQN